MQIIDIDNVGERVALVGVLETQVVSNSLFNSPDHVLEGV